VEEERQIRLTVVLAGACWLAGAAIVVVGILLSMYGVPAIGLMFCLAGAVLNIRSFTRSFADLLRDAFEGGREFERLHSERAEVRALR
jgi:hypothetical protein